jgi:hypothetical protein
VYLDDGANTHNSKPGFRQYDGSNWKDLGGQREWLLSRTLPTTVDNYVQIGYVDSDADACNMDIAITVGDPGISLAKRYLFTIQYDDLTQDTWYTVLPSTDAGAYAWAGGDDQDIALDVMWSSTSPYNYYFRLRRVSGSTAGTAYINILQMGRGPTSLTPQTGTGSMTAPTSYYRPEGAASGLVHVNKPTAGLDDSHDTFGTSEYDCVEVSITTRGGTVEVTAQCTAYYDGSNDFGFHVYLYREESGESDVALVNLGAYTINTNNRVVTVPVQCDDAPGAGTYTYSLRIKRTSGSATSTVTGRRMRLKEIIS